MNIGVFFYTILVALFCMVVFTVLVCGDGSQ